MGVLDGPMGQVADILINTFVDELRTWTRRDASGYDPVAGTDPVTETTAEIKTGPPAPFENNKVNGTSIRTGDVQVVVARLEVERRAPFDPFPATDVTLVVDIDGVEHKVLNVENFISGDQAAAFRFHLRK